LVLRADGSLWAGTAGGLGDFSRPLSGRMLRIVEVIGKAGELAQGEQTLAVTVFDDSYLTQPGMFHYIWRLSEISLLSSTPGPEIKTRSSVYRAVFPHDGVYQLRVVAVDRYGNRSDPKDIDFKVKHKTLWDTLTSMDALLIASIAGLAGSLLPFLVKATSAWRRRESADKIQINLDDAIITLAKLDPEAVYKVIELLRKKDGDRKTKPSQPESR
jgi:hypothetical protein